MATCRELFEEELLSCSNCQQSFYSDADQPAAIHLPCLDMVCSVCLANIWESDSMQCPVHLCVYDMRDINVADLQIDETAKDIQIFSTVRNETQTCTSCQSGEAAHHFCPTCDAYLCTSRCLDAHQHMKSYSSHKPVSLDGEICNLTQCIERKCEKAEHEEKKTIFCERCRKSICDKCDRSDHRSRGHEIRNITEVYENFRAILERSLNDINRRLTEAEEILDTVNKDSLIKNLVRAKSDLKDNLQKTQRLMKIRKNYIEDSLQQEYQTKRNVLDHRVQLFKAKADLERCVKYLRYALKYKDRAGLLDVSFIAQERAKCLKDISFGEIGSDELSCELALQTLVEPLIHAPSTTLSCAGPAVAGQPHKFCIQLKNTKGRIVCAKDLDIFVLVTIQGRVVDRVTQPSVQNAVGHLKIKWRPSEAGEHKIAVLLFMGTVEIWNCLLTVYQPDESSLLDNANKSAQVCETQRRTSSQTSGESDFTGNLQDDDTCPNCEAEILATDEDHPPDEGSIPSYESTHYPDIHAHIGIGGIYSTEGVSGIDRHVPRAYREGHNRAWFGDQRESFTNDETK